jgi:1-deoxy-D-xylulose-5-phosphate reductoisomerase
MENAARLPQVDADAVPRTLTVLGATGSIGQSTLDLVGRNRRHFAVRALTANRNAGALARMAQEFDAELAVIADEGLYGELKSALAGTSVRVAAGASGLDEAARLPVDMTMAGIIGAAGLRPTFAALATCRRVMLANKECLVAAGAVFMAEVARRQTELIPVDSEHSAIFQALDGSPPETIHRITLTASGGPFRGLSLDQLQHVTPAQALKHPNWDMGRKITIDSASMMNKGLELIEALHLFPVGPQQLEVVVHPQSIVHSLVSYVDGSVIAQLGVPDMRTPIAYSLAYPARMPTPIEALDLARIGQLTFEAPDETRFPALRLAREAMLAGGNAACIMNAANEVAVEAFLQGRIGFPGIPRLCAAAIERVQRTQGSAVPLTLDEVLEIDQVTRLLAQRELLM